MELIRSNKLQVLFVIFLLFSGAISQAQSTTITGTVIGDGYPLPGVSVVIKGTNNGVVTDFDGNFSIDGESSVTLVFSYVGFITKEILVEGKTNLEVTLEPDLAKLDEVVIVGYGTQKKSDVTGAVSSISSEDIQKTANVSINQAIQGRAAGVTVSKTSGSPGASPTVRIRGTGTVNNADPLYVVDGIPVNDIRNINMADAESIEVLKDASATAIYGSRGANGVVLIQTKTGKSEKPVLSYNMYTGFQSRVDNIDILSGPQWGMLSNEANRNDGNEINPDFANPESLPTYAWEDAAYRDGLVQNHQLSFSGRSDKTTYYVSYGYISQEGVIKGSSYKRQNLRVNNTYQLTEDIKFGHNLQYANSSRISSPESGQDPWRRAAFVGYIAEPITPLFQEDGSYGVTQYSSAVNPLGLVEFGSMPEKRENFLGNFFLEANLAEGLLFRSNFGVDINKIEVDNYIPDYNVAPTYNSPESTYILNRAEQKSLVWSNTLNYNKVFNKKHDFTALLGHEIQEISYNNVNAQRSEIPGSVSNPTLGSGNVATASNNGGRSESKLLSFFGRLNYNFDERYLVTATYRVDGSSRFGSNNRWGKFPSMALGWNIHNEDFFQTDFINQLKFRAGWGETGNQNLPNASTFNTLDLNTNYPFGINEITNVGAAPLRPGNQDLKWETTVTQNVGIDMAFWKNQLSFTADYFIKNTTDLLLAVPILATSGYQQSPFGNAGDIENKGLELSTTYRKNINDFNFKIGGNVSFIRNKVTELATDGSLILSAPAQGFGSVGRTEVGHSLASFHGYEMIGIFQTQEEVENNAAFPNTQPGDVRYRDINEDGIINDDDKTYIGSPFPDFTYGLNFEVNYKQWDLSLFFQGTQGNDIFNASAYYLEADLGTNLSTKMLDRWTGEGTSNAVPRVTYLNNGVNTQQSSRFVRDGSYGRLKNAQLGYAFSESLLESLSISKLRIYVSGQNLLTFTNYDGLDPEIGVDQTFNNPLDIGVDRGRYPSTRTVTLGLDVTF
ncbi:TonB-linked outer membrane protein, SusC/RagA family [Salegentibacter agarivorans]|uniref:TonB-linked outer membrane protein, SusC/RagA family n=1 Tax=Salegentibacter agarivorans TaxID=345907 RepID=A0A1I2KS28_9FLAO|nr:TonB-dependent receptor [Salegentibacter agarivorans]SFF67921.1 TonB-linked outer membrane protein, SusC/RagA family [Salegentibacter agarivorans]